MRTNDQLLVMKNLVCVFIIVAFLGNSIILIIFVVTKELQTHVNYFLASLALADLMTALFPMPLWLNFKIYNRWPFSMGLLKTWISADLMFCTASVCNLCAISIDRCLAIAWPFVHRSWFTPFRTKCALAIVWVYSCFIVLFITDWIKWKKRGVIISCASFYIPMVIIITAYVTIFISQNKSRMELASQEISTRHRSKQDLKMAKYTLLIIVSFLVCWVGQFSMGTVYAFTTPKVSSFIKDCIKNLSYLNSAINPFLYGYVSPKFRLALKAILRCRRRLHQPMSHTWTQMSPARGISSNQTSITKITEKASIGSQEESTV
ncbi:5-hydroxytryptamine receptor 1A-alpha-like [Xenia sp. Carnegie-2017]|uniref:5-hydroxytryptamine receptor 1A-alpha-like n=1 Tax=Xenia sp. Carnegie-2017 TaxID=2897299 RepID=UPI001F03E121|nr:5-hydroxytryptamine receptor 1A-alpha-like [Xenia sp. Carnegie-2017]